VPSLQKALNDISLEKDAAVIAKVFNTCLSSLEYFFKIVHSDLLIMHACLTPSSSLLPGMLSRRML
jgi:hypothetical protein